MIGAAIFWPTLTALDAFERLGATAPGGELYARCCLSHRNPAAAVTCTISNLALASTA
jgi:hypothetical protein